MSQHETASTQSWRPVADALSSIPQFEDLSPFRNEPGKVPISTSLRNAAFDQLFYDVSSLNNTEVAKLLANAFDYDEGGMLFVYPTKEDKEIEYFDRSKLLLDAHPELDTVTIAGVGSSVIGTAAFARQIANYLGRPSVGIIAGYGAADVMSEALGGFFDFGMANKIRAILARWRDQFVPITKEEKEDLLHRYSIKSTTYLADEPESNTLLNIMLRHADCLKAIVGHSKGALNIGNVLPKFLQEVKHATAFSEEDYRDITVVTLGCGISLPEPFRNKGHQYLGNMDMLGRYNTPRSIKEDPGFEHLEWVRGKVHSLAGPIPLHMPVDEVLRDAGL